MAVSGSGSEKFLLHGENVEYRTHKHVIVLLRPALAAFGALLLESILLGWTDVNVVTFVGLLGVLFLLLRLAWKIAEWRIEAIYITDWRIFEVSGLLTRKVAALPLRKITDLTYEISQAGRLIGFGRFVLETAGQDQALSSLDHVPDPHQMYEILSHLTLHGSLSTARRPPDASIADDTRTIPVPYGLDGDDD